MQALSKDVYFIHCSLIAILKAVGRPTCSQMTNNACLQLNHEIVVPALYKYGRVKIIFAMDRECYWSTTDQLGHQYVFWDIYKTIGKNSQGVGDVGSGNI